MLSSLALFALFALGCGYRGPCAEVCVARADCLQSEIDAYGSTWPQFTGFADRGDYEAECFGVFEDGRDDEAKRRELRKVCQAELEQACDP